MFMKEIRKKERKHYLLWIHVKCADLSKGRTEVTEAKRFCELHFSADEISMHYDLKDFIQTDSSNSCRTIVVVTIFLWFTTNLNIEVLSDTNDNLTVDMNW